MVVVEIDARLVEDAVLAVLQPQPRSDYWRERDHVYALSDPDDRDRAFGVLHRKHFEALNLGAPLLRALAEQPLVEEHVQLCRVIPIASQRDECAELFVASADDRRKPPAARWIVLRVRPALFSAPEALLTFLRHELQHIADMVDPAFRYDPAMPEVVGGAMRLKLVLSRYRVLWDTVIDGRLVRRGHAPETVRDLRLRELERSFPMLGDHAAEAFERWFHTEAPTHEMLLELALDPRGAMGLEDLPGSLGICPLCNCPGDLSATRDPLSQAVRSRIAADFPAWQPSVGICSQCAELYRSRSVTSPAAV